MRKIVVFDTGWGGEIIARKLEEFLPIEVVKIIAWREGILEEGRSAGEVRRITERALRGYLGTNDVIVLAEPAVALMVKGYLKRRYPDQVFIGGLMGVRFGEEQALILATPALRCQREYQIQKARVSRLVEPNCAGWAEKIQDGELSDEDVAGAVKDFSGRFVVILSTNFIDVREQIAKMVPKKTRIIDLSKLMIREVCIELGLTGRDGREWRQKKSKEWR